MERKILRECREERTPGGRAVSRFNPFRQFSAWLALLLLLGTGCATTMHALPQNPSRELNQRGRQQACTLRLFDGSTLHADRLELVGDSLHLSRSGNLQLALPLTDVYSASFRRPFHAMAVGAAWGLILAVPPALVLTPWATLASTVNPMLITAATASYGMGLGMAAGALHGAPLILILTDDPVRYKAMVMQDKGMRSGRLPRLPPRNWHRADA